MADRGAAKKRRRGWRTPMWRDPAFWTAVGLTAVAVAAQAAFIEDRGNALSWAALALQAVVTWIIFSALIRIRVGMRRALVEGAAEAEARARAKPAGISTSETLARTSGRAVGKMYGAYKRSQQK